MTRSHTSARKPPGTTSMRLTELFGPRAARSRASSELRSISCGNQPRVRRATMTTTTPRMRRTTVRFLNGLSRGAYVIILPGSGGAGTRVAAFRSFHLTYMAPHRKARYIMSMGYPPSSSYPSRPLASSGPDLDATVLLARDHEHLRRLLDDLAAAAS